MSFSTAVADGVLEIFTMGNLDSIIAAVALFVAKLILFRLQIYGHCCRWSMFDIFNRQDVE